MKRSLPTTFLFDLDPKGLGSFEVESLASYLVRLSERHGMSPHQLLSCLDAWYRQTYNSIVPRFFSIRVNGYSPNVQRLVQALQNATNRTDLSACTLLSLQQVCAKNNSDSIKPYRAWCPACLREDRDLGRSPYERLIWQLVGTHRCSVHRTRLEVCCRQCGGKQHWQRCSTPDTCGDCGRSLMSLPRSARLLPPDPGERHIVELLECTASVPFPNFRQEAAGAFILGISKHVDMRDAVERLGRILRKAEHTRPSLCSLLHISEYFDVSTTLILSSPEQAANVASLNVGKPRLPRRLRGNYLPRGARKSAIECALKKCLNSKDLAPTLRQFCQDHGFCQSTVNQRGRDLVMKLMAKRKLQLSSARVTQTRKIDRSLSRLSVSETHGPIKRRLERIAMETASPLWLIRQRYLVSCGQYRPRARNGMLYVPKPPQEN